MTTIFLPILYPEKPKRLSITMANTIFGALSSTRPINWGRLIQELVEKMISYILHLYHYHGCVNEAEENNMTIAEDEVAYKLPSRI